MNRSKALTWTELRVGVVTIISLIVLAVTIVYVGSGGGSPFAKTYELKALMSDINGLKPGAPVRVGGLEVGTVKHVDFDQKGGMVQVTMKLARRVQPREGIARAERAPAGGQHRKQEQPVRAHDLSSAAAQKLCAPCAPTANSNASISDQSGVVRQPTRSLPP